MLRIIKPGLQATLQGAPRCGHRHFGVPYAGPADPLSMSLANRLVGNQPDATSLEVTYGGFEAEVEAACSIAITGALGGVLVAGETAPEHTTLHLRSGDTVEVAPPAHGMRAYLALRSGFQANTAFGSTSTYLPADLGGMNGRALHANDRLQPVGEPHFKATFETPASHRPVFTSAVALRACISAETHLLTRSDRMTLYSETFIAGRQATRMGVSLTGHTLAPKSDGKMKSAPVFPGTVQCPPSGEPVVLLCDGQTTGGYPRIASIARCDRHLLGQIRPGDCIQLLERAPDAALQDYHDKQRLLNDWLAA